MSAPFIALTVPAANGFGSFPVFINAILVRSVVPRRVRKMGENGQPLRSGGPESWEIQGSYVSVGDGENECFAVGESYGEVTGAIQDAFK